MKLALVIGTTIATIKDENLIGRKLLIVREADTTGKPDGAPFVAVDTVSAGAGTVAPTGTAHPRRAERRP